MSKIFSVESLADKYINWKFSDTEISRRVRNIETFNFKVTGFNISTAAMIATLALSIITGSLVLAALFILSHALRSSFMRAVLTTGIEIGGDGRDRASYIFERLFLPQAVITNQTNQEIREFLGIQEENWKLLNMQFMDFNLWMNLAPSQDLVAPVASATVAEGS